MPDHAQGGRAEQRPLHAMRGPIAQDTARRAATRPIRLLVVCEAAIQKILDLLGRLQLAEYRALRRCKRVVPGIGGHCAQVNPTAYTGAYAHNLAAASPR